MSVFDGKRLAAKAFRNDADRLRAGWYSDAYFNNAVKILAALAEEGYVFHGQSDLKDMDRSVVMTGDLIVEMQYFTRRQPFSLVAGVDEALAILQECSGYYDADGRFVNTFDNLELEAVQDGTFAHYEGNPLEVQPVLKVRGRYRDIAQLETPILGVLTETTRVATNVYNVLAAAGGKDVLFFPARFAHYRLQELHGYAYSLAVQAFNREYGKSSRAIVSTDAQGAFVGGVGSGTLAHSTIACFLGDTVETMMQFSRIMPAGVPRIALIDFHNDCVGEALKVMAEMFKAYWGRLQAGDAEEAQKYRLFGVRPDTGGTMRDISLEPTGDKSLDCGVNPRLVWTLRKSMDQALAKWNLTGDAAREAEAWCKAVKIIATGGFNVKKIKWFEEQGVPVDIYGVGSALLENSSENSTNNDFTADIVRVQLDGKWHPLCKVGRQACNNPNLAPY